MAEVESRSRVSTDNLARDHLYDKRLETQSSLVGLCQYPVCPVCDGPCYSLSVLLTSPLTGHGLASLSPEVTRGWAWSKHHELAGPVPGPPRSWA